MFPNRQASGKAATHTLLDGAQTGSDVLLGRGMSDVDVIRLSDGGILVLLIDDPEELPETTRDVDVVELAPSTGAIAASGDVASTTG